MMLAENELPLFERPAAATASWEGNSGLEFPPFVHNLSDCGFVESKLFRDGFVTFSSLMSNINSFSEVLSDLQWHDSLPLSDLHMIRLW